MYIETYSFLLFSFEMTPQLMVCPRCNRMICTSLMRFFWNVRWLSWSEVFLDEFVNSIRIGTGKLCITNIWIQDPEGRYVFSMFSRCSVGIVYASRAKRSAQQWSIERIQWSYNGLTPRGQPSLLTANQPTARPQLDPMLPCKGLRAPKDLPALCPTKRWRRSGQGL